jgi:hypothetical protein
MNIFQLLALAWRDRDAMAARLFRAFVASQPQGMNAEREDGR